MIASLYTKLFRNLLAAVLVPRGILKGSPTLEHPTDPDTAWGTQDSPETVLIYEKCQQGFHLGCFGLATVPDDVWEWPQARLRWLSACKTLYGAGQGPHQGHHLIP